MAKKNKEGVAGVKKKKGSRHIGLAVLLIVVLALGYVAFTYGSLPYALLTAKNRNASTLVSIMLSKLNSANVAKVNYTGSVIVNKSDPRVIFFYNKDGNVTNIYLDILHNNDAFVLINATLANLTEPGTVCITTHTPNSILHGPSCVWSKPYKIFLNATDQIAELQTLGNVSIKSFGLNSYGGQACYNMNGTATVMVNGTLAGMREGYMPATLNFSGCLSAQYDIPLELKGYAETKNGYLLLFSFGSSDFAYRGNFGDA